MGGGEEGGQIEGAEDERMTAGMRRRRETEAGWWQEGKDSKRRRDGTRGRRADGEAEGSREGSGLEWARSCVLPWLLFPATAMRSNRKPGSSEKSQLKSSSLPLPSILPTRPSTAHLVLFSLPRLVSLQKTTWPPPRAVDRCAVGCCQTVPRLKRPYSLNY